jgi:MFS family permease
MKPRFSVKQLRTFQSFKNPVYTLFYCGTASQWASGSMQGVIRILLIYRLTGSGSILGLMALVQALPMFFLSLFGGVIADRFSKKWIITIGQVIQSLSVFVVAFTLHTGYLSAENTGSWWVLIVTAAVQGTIAGLIQPSGQAIIRDIVDEEGLMNAISLANMGQNTFQLIGPAIAGFFIEAFGFTWTYFIIASIQLLGSFFFLIMPVISKVNVNLSNPLKDIPEGLRYVLKERVLLWILMVAAAGSFLAMPIAQLMPIFTEDILNVGADGLGILLSIAGLGSIVGSLIFASIRSKKRGAIFLLSGVLVSIILIAFSFSENWYISLGLIVVFGLARTGKTTLEPVLLQTYTTSEYRGRVMSLLIMQMSFFNFGTFLAGVFSDLVGIQWTITGMAAVFLLISILMWYKVPVLRKLP